MRRFMWGNYPNRYNFCSETIFGGAPLFEKDKDTEKVNYGIKEYGFIFIQVMRLIFFFSNLVTFFVFLFIYMRVAPFIFLFWPLLLTTLCFLFLLIGNGKQVVYQ